MKFPCRRCLLEGVTPEQMQAKIQSYIDAMPESDRCSEEEYRRRLSVCEACTSLHNGLCKECGCFVLYRAAIQKNDCPHVKHFW